MVVIMKGLQKIRKNEKLWIWIWTNRLHNMKNNPVQVLLIQTPEDSSPGHSRIRLMANHPILVLIIQKRKGHSVIGEKGETR